MLKSMDFNTAWHDRSWRNHNMPEDQKEDQRRFTEGDRDHVIQRGGGDY